MNLNTYTMYTCNAPFNFENVKSGLSQLWIDELMELKYDGVIHFTLTLTIKDQENIVVLIDAEFYNKDEFSDKVFWILKRIFEMNDIDENLIIENIVLIYRRNIINLFLFYLNMYKFWFLLFPTIILISVIIWYCFYIVFN